MDISQEPITEETAVEQGKPEKRKFQLKIPELETRDWVLIALLLFAAIAPFWKMWEYAWQQWFKDTGYYQHGIFVPLLVGYMLWRRWDDLRQVSVQPATWAIAIVVLGALVGWWGSRVDSQVVRQFGFMVFLFGSCLYVLGTKVTRALLIPIILVGFMLPLPDLVFSQMTNSGQVYSTKLAVKMLDFLGYEPHMVNNSVITLDNYQMEVGVPCSGFKLTMALLMFGLFFCSIARFNWWRSIIMFLVLVPVALIVNSWRIGMIGIFGEHFGDAAGKLFHDWGSYLELVLAYGALFGLARLLGWKE